MTFVLSLRGAIATKQSRSVRKRRVRHEIATSRYRGPLAMTFVMSLRGAIATKQSRSVRKRRVRHEIATSRWRGSSR
jgi:hypothetical protein